MRFSIRLAALLAIGVGAVNIAHGQGPIREGLRRTGEAAADVTRGVVQGTADVARSVGEAAAGTVRTTADVLTPATPLQARGDGNFDNSRDARWRFARHNNEWWYYAPSNQWMYHREGDWQQFSQDSFQPMNDGQQLAQGEQFDQGQQYSAGYRGEEQGRMAQDQGVQHDQGFQQQVRHDRYGRAFICENGRPVYIQEGQFQAEGQLQQDQGLSPTPAMPEEHGAARQNLDQQATPPQPAQPPQGDIQQGQSLESNQSIQSTAPAASANTGDGADVSSAPAGPVSDSQAQPGAAAPREINNNPTSQTQGATDNPNQ